MGNEWPPPDLAEWDKEMRAKYVHVRIPLLSPGMTPAAYFTPAFQRYMQETVQEVVLRYQRPGRENE